MERRIEEIRRSNLRRAIVDALYSAATRADGRPLAGDVLFDFANDELGHSFTDVDEFVQLARELAIKGLIEELPGETRRRGEGYALRHSRWKVTPRGVEVATESGPREPGVWDSRISGEDVE